MYHPTDRITHTTAFVTPVVEHWLEREIAQWVYPMKERSTSELRPAPVYKIVISFREQNHYANCKVLRIKRNRSTDQHIP